MLREECERCLGSPCLCEVKNLKNYLKGLRSLEFIGFKDHGTQNNSFLSTALQTLFHSISFNQILYESCPETSECIICLLKNFKDDIDQCKSENIYDLEITHYKENFARICRNQIFSTGIEGDPLEIIEIILANVHYCSKNEKLKPKINMKCEGPCHAHSLCCNLIQEQNKCTCGSTEKLNTSNSFIFKVKAESFHKRVPQDILSIFCDFLNEDLEELHEKSMMKEIRESFSRVVHEEMEIVKNSRKIENCKNCKRKTEKTLAFISKPKIIIFQIEHSKIKFNPLETLQVLISLSGKISVCEIIKSENELEMGLKGLIVYIENRFFYCGIGEDFKWHIVGDAFSHTIGNGRWYDVLLYLLSMKGIPVGLLYEEFHIADLSLFKIELLFLEKIVYYSAFTNEIDLRSLEDQCEFGINPIKVSILNSQQKVECVNCLEEKNLGEICSLCGFDPKVSEWICKCGELNFKLTLMCDFCDKDRYSISKPIFVCPICHSSVNFRFCKKCDRVSKCKICQKEIFAVQSIICNKCKDFCKEGYCSKCKTYEMVCRKCRNLE